MVFGKHSLRGYESNRRLADGVRVEHIPRNHKGGPPREYFKIPDGSWDKIAEHMMVNFSESGHPIFRSSSAFEKGELRSKEHGSEENIELLLRTIISANQLSIFGAVADSLGGPSSILCYLRGLLCRLIHTSRLQLREFEIRHIGVSSGTFTSTT